MNSITSGTYGIGKYFRNNQSKPCYLSGTSSSCHGNHTGSYATNDNYCNCKVATADIAGTTGGIQCFGYARYVFYQLFGLPISTCIGSNSYTLDSTANVTKVGQCSGNADESEVSSVFAKAKMGDFIQAKTSSGGKHSMIVHTVSSSHVTVLECNAAGDCCIGTRVLSSSNFASKYPYFTVYRSTNYPSGSSSSTEKLNPGLKNLTSSSYAICYTVENAHYPVYTDSSFITRGYGNTASSTADIDGGDEIWIIDVGVNSSGTAYAHIKYKLPSGSYTTAYVPLHSTLVPGTLADSYRTANKTVSGFSRRPGETTYSSYQVNSGDKVYLLSKQNGYCQILYPKSNTLWSIAWCTESQYNSMFTYTVSYNANGGEGAPGSQTKTYGVNLTLSSTKPTKTGHTFVGWATTRDATTPEYFSGGTYTKNAAVTLYAVWEKNPVVLSSIAIDSLPTKTTYKIGEALDTSGLKLKLTYSDSTTESVTTGFTTSEFSSETAGIKTVIVSYGDKTTSFNVTVEHDADENAPQIVVENVTATAGQTVQITIALKNNPGIAGLAVSLKYDESVLTLIGTENSKLFSGFTSAKNFTWDESTDVSDDGVLATFTFKVAEDAEAGEYSVEVLVRSCINENLDDVELSTTSGKISVISFIYGDCNGDGKIDMKDLVLLRKYIADFDYDTNTSSVSVELGADVNGDNKIDMKDVVLLRRYIANYDYDTGSSTVVLGP